MSTTVMMMMMMMKKKKKNLIRNVPSLLLVVVAPLLLLLLLLQLDTPLVCGSATETTTTTGLPRVREIVVDATAFFESSEQQKQPQRQEQQQHLDGGVHTDVTTDTDLEEDKQQHNQDEPERDVEVEGEDFDDEDDDPYDDDPFPEFVYPYEDFPYYIEEFDDDGTSTRLPVCSGNNDQDNDDANTATNVEECEDPYAYTLTEFVVAGKNLATYRLSSPQPPPPFELYSDFDISSYVQGDEGWMDMLYIRRQLQRPTLSWYVDKVARKRWLVDHGYPQPQIYHVMYRHELLANVGFTSTASLKMVQEEDLKTVLADEILHRHLPTNHSFAAKPTHMSLTMGSWLVDITMTPTAITNAAHEGNGTNDTTGTNSTTTTVSFSTSAQQLNDDWLWDPRTCAASLTEGLFRKAATIESWALHQVPPGLVVEELFTSHEDPQLPPQEFCLFCIWGRVYVAQWNFVLAEGRFMNGFYYRNGQITPGCPDQSPDRIEDDWIPWAEMIAMAESLAAHKDMLRVDFLVGVPKEEWKKSNRDGTSPPIRMVVSESEIFPTTMFTSPFIAEEAARLWVGGYKLGNYKVVPNSEVPRNYLQSVGKMELDTRN